MSYQIFRGATAEQAKRAMRQALGPDAVVLATNRLPDGTFEMRGIRKGEPLFPGEGGPSKGLFGKTRQEVPAPAPSLGGLPEPRVGDALGTPHTYARDGADSGEARRQHGDAAQALRGDFSRQLSRDPSRDDPLYQRWEHKLGLHGITPELIRALVDAAHAEPHGNQLQEPALLARALGAVLRFAPLNILRDAPVMLVGQTGAGKTSSAAKLAQGAAEQSGRLNLISADTGRAGAMDQMQTYADALDTRFWGVDDPRQVAEIVRREGQSGVGFVLDTPGVSPFAQADIQAVRAFREALGAEMLLVLPASGDVSEHTDWMNAFGALGVRRAIITKFDASRRIGAAISACYHSGMALAYFSEAPFIAIGLIDAHPDYLARRLLMDVPQRIGA